MLTLDETQDLADPHGAGIFAISYEMLAHMLVLPDGVAIVGVTDEDWEGRLNIAVRGPGLPKCQRGQRMPRVRVMVTSSGGRPVSCSFEPLDDPAQDEVVRLRAEVARLSALVQDDGR